MSERAVKPIYLELPEALVRAAKADAAIRGEKVRDWWRAAAEAKLRRTEAEPETTA